MTTAYQAKAEAMGRVDAGADYDWKECADTVVEAICEGLGFGEEFTTDLVWEMLETTFPTAKTHEPRALGPVMARAAKNGLIRKTDRVKDSEREECHARPVAIWKVATFSVGA